MKIKRYSDEDQDRQRYPISLREAMGKLFDESIWDPFEDRGLWSDKRPSGFFPSVDISETEKEVKIAANIPGIDPEKVNIEVDEESVVLSGTIEEEKESSDASYYRFEREFGEFHRNLFLPAKVDPDKVSASAKNGVITIILPKSVDKESRKKIGIKKSS